MNASRGHWTDLTGGFRHPKPALARESLKVTS